MTFTPDSELDLAFDPSLISPSATEKLDAGLHLRPLSSSDYARGHFEVLAALTKAPDVGSSAWSNRFNLMKTSNPTSYYPIVIIDRSNDRIVGSGTVFIEFKFLRGLGKVAHIEDIVVAPAGQGKGLGKVIIAALTSIAEREGCYKTILDCSEENRPFYEKCGYKFAGVEMAKYAENA